MTARLLSLASLALALAAAVGYFGLLRLPAVRNHFGVALAVVGASVLLALLAVSMRRSPLPIGALAVALILLAGGAFFHFWYSRLPTQAKVAVGQPAPDFTLPDAAGRPVTLSSFRGQKAVVLVFYRGYW